MKTKKIISLLLAALFILSSFTFTSVADTRTIKPDTWAATDGLGRTLSSYEETGGKREDKFVGMFYWIWHYPWISNHEPITTGSVLDLFPDAVNDWEHPAWNDTYDGRPYFWGEPLLGFYTNTDEYVLRKHAELLADADIDVVIFDATNATNVFTEGYEALLKVWSEAREDGVDTPDIAFMLNFGDYEDIRTELYDIYDNLYSQGRYEDLWFYWEGKPLVMATIGALDIKNSKDREIFNFFTFRKNESTYFCEDFSMTDGVWGWCSDYPQTKFGKTVSGKVEQMCVSVAQNADENGLTAMNDPIGTVQGRSFTDGYFSYTYSYGGKETTVDKNTENSLLYGLNFQQQWDYAIENDPEFIFVTGFNEWIAGRFTEWNKVENAFPDQFSPEYSRDIEPSNGILKDHYYYQLVENVRRFKGVSASDKNEAEKTIDIYGSASQWDSVFPEYNHYEGNTKSRNSAGWMGYHYENTTGRNDIVQAKVAFDSDNIYFYVKTAAMLTDSKDLNWMRLFIDTDISGISENMNAFEYTLNRISPENGKTVLEKCLGDGKYQTVCEAHFCADDNILQIAVPRNALGLTEDEIKFNFKWADNVSGEDALEFYTDGDCAPGGRFTFVFDSKATGTENTDSNTDNDSFICKIFEKISLSFDSFKIFCRKIIAYIKYM